MSFSFAARVAACVLATASAVAGATVAAGQEPPAPTPVPYFGDYSALTEPVGDLSILTEVGAWEQPPVAEQPVAEPPQSGLEAPPAAELPQSADASAPAQAAAPAQLPATGASSTADATRALQLCFVALLAGAACVALSRALRRA